MPLGHKIEEAPEMVDHPAHYSSLPVYCRHGHLIECIDVVRVMPFIEGCIVKYLWRGDYKLDGANKLEDYKKARRYLDFEIERLEALEARKNGKIDPVG